MAGSSRGETVDPILGITVASEPLQIPSFRGSEKWANDMEAQSDSQRPEANCCKLAGILPENGLAPPLTRTKISALARRVARTGISLAAVILAAGCAGDLSDIDRKVERVLASRSQGLGGGAVTPEVAFPRPDLPPHRDLAEKQPASINPPAEELRFNPAAEGRDFAAKLAELQNQSAGEDGANVRMLDLAACWRQSQETAREFLTAEEDYILAGIRLLIERHRWSVRLFANSTVDFGYNQRDSVVSSSAVSIVNSLGARKQLPFGGQVAAEWVWRATEDLRERASDRYIQSSQLVLSGNVPLLRGAGLVAEESRIQAERDLVYAARDFESFRREFLVSIARDYFALLQQQDNLASTERQVEALRQIRDRQAALYDAGRVARFEVNLAENDLLNAEAGLANARESLILALDRFRIRLGLPDGVRVRVEPSDFAVPEPDVTLEQAVAMALDYRLDLQNRRDRLTDSRRAVKIAANQLLPDLDVRGSISFPTEPGPGEGGANEQGVVYELDDVDYNAGLSLEIPLDREIERLALRSSIIGLGQAQRSFEQFRDQVVIDVRARVREIERARFNLQLAEDRVQINLRRDEEQLIKEDEVDAQTRVDTANAIRDAERARDQAKTDLRNAVLDYLLATGTLRVRRDGTFQPLPGMERVAPPILPPDDPAPLPEPEPDPAGQPPAPAPARADEPLAQ